MGSAMNPDDLIHYLVEKRLLQPERAKAVLEQPGASKDSIERTLVDNGLLEETVLLEAMAEVYGLPYYQLDSSVLDAELASTVPHKFLKTFCVYPLKREMGSGVVPLVMADPFDISVIDTFRYITGYQVQPAIAHRREIEGAIAGVPLGRQGLTRIAEQVPWDEALDVLQDAPEPELESEHSKPIIFLVNSLLRGAVQSGASDIHFEPQENEVRVRFRIDGILQEIVNLHRRVSRACVARIKIMAELDISECRKPQDGRIQLRMAHGPVDLRVSVLPTVWGEKVVMRLLDRTGEPPSLTQLGLAPSDLEAFGAFLKASNGMILLTGPTGSGKTSTLYAALTVLNQPGVNISTVEDPVEYQMAGVNQVAVNRKAGLTFPAALRSFLRQDPDIIMVGEIRDLETARIAVQAAQTGHLVFSTLHTNDAPSTLERLVLMGLEPHLVSGSLLCVVAQRLVRRLCLSCRRRGAATDEQLALLATSYESPKLGELWEAVGCEDCGGSGYKGRMGLYELLTVTARVKQQILTDPSEELLWKVAREEGLKTLLEDGLVKAEKGLTSLAEVLRVVTIKRRAINDSDCPPESVKRTPQNESWDPPLRVLDVMTGHVRILDSEESVESGVRHLLEWGVSGAVVMDGDEAVGVFSMADLAALVSAGERSAADCRVSDVMSAWIIKVHPNTPLRRAQALFKRHKVHRLIVMQGKQVVGVLTPLDLVSVAPA